jgi:mannan endo-1,4-beta-mannosidase
MTELTRRSALASIAGAAAVLSGCGRPSESRATTATQSPTNGRSPTGVPRTKATTTASEDESTTTTPEERAIVEAEAPSITVTDFVDVDGMTFVVGDEPIEITGFNNDALTSPYSERARVDEIIEEMNALRIWGFCHGVPEGETDPERCFQPAPGEYGERAFERLDYVIEKAKCHGVRLIVPLVNNWDNVGSMKDYVRWVYPDHGYPEGRNGRGELHDTFYTDENVRELFLEYVEHVVTRQNSISGVEYRNDPAIMMWELANEPRISAASQSALAEWIEETSAFIKDLDANHLVSAGTEGKYDVEIHQPSSIDAYSFHCWPDHWNMSVEEGTAWIEDRTTEALDQLAKPAYLGEFGWPVHREKNARKQIQRRDEVFQTWIDTLDRVNCNGSLVYALRGHAYNRGSDGRRPPLYRRRGDHADPYAIYHPEDRSTVELLQNDIGR